MAEVYEVLAEEPLAIDTVKDPHNASCLADCADHKHEHREVTYGQTFDVADIWPRNANVAVLVSAGLVRKVEPKPAAEDPPAAAAADTPPVKKRNG